MEDLSNHAVYQAEEWQCVGATYATAIRHFSASVGIKGSCYPGLSDLTQVVKDPYIESIPVPVDNPADRVNEKFFRSLPVKAKAREGQSLEDLEQIIEDEGCSLPVVSLHPDYLVWQPGINTSEEIQPRHMVIVKSVESGSVEIWDPLKKGPNSDIEDYKQVLDKNMFMDFWEKTVSRDSAMLEEVTDKVSAEIHWFNNKQLKEGQRTL